MGDLTAAGITLALARWLVWIGALLIVGFLSRYVGLVLAVIMLVATVMVHLPNGYGMSGNGVEYTLTLLLLSLAMVTFGSGRLPK